MVNPRPHPMKKTTEDDDKNKRAATRTKLEQDFTSAISLPTKVTLFTTFATRFDVFQFSVFLDNFESKGVNEEFRGGQ